MLLRSATRIASKCSRRQDCMLCTSSKGSVQKRASVAARRVSKSWLVLLHGQSTRCTASLLRRRIDHGHAFMKGIVTSSVSQYLPKRSGYCSRTISLRRPISRHLRNSLALGPLVTATIRRPSASATMPLVPLLKTMKFHKVIVASSARCGKLCSDCALKVLNFAINPFVPVFLPVKPLRSTRSVHIP